MKAARIHNYGGSESIVIDEIEKPQPNTDQVLIEVHAASINPFDAKVRSGAMKDFIPLELPVTLGGDIAGVVTEVGDNVEGLAVGDQVYGQANAVAGASGAFAEYAAAKATQLAKKPLRIGFAKAGAIPLTGVSAIQAIEDKMKLQPGQKILIHGGAGGIGTAAIQLAKHLGAYVATTATGDQIKYVKQLGADEVVDYKNQEFDAELRDYDFVFDTIGGETYMRSFTVLKPGGTVVSMLEQPNEAWMQEYGVVALLQNTQVNTPSLQRLATLIDEEVITVHITKTYQLVDIRQAFEAYESNSVKGKIAVIVK